jgi:hypothetical protein
MIKARIDQNTLIAVGIYEVREGDAVEFLERLGHTSDRQHRESASARS